MKKVNLIRGSHSEASLLCLSWSRFGGLLASCDLCLMPYVLCLMSYVLCGMSCVLCLMSYVSCGMSHVVCLASYVLPEARPAYADAFDCILRLVSHAYKQRDPLMQKLLTVSCVLCLMHIRSETRLCRSFWTSYRLMFHA